MPKYLLLSILVLVPFIVDAQSKEPEFFFCGNPIATNFPGGNKAWQKYIVATSNPDIAQKALKPKKGETKTQSITASFNIDTTGEIIDIKVDSTTFLNKILIEETIRILQKSPKWIPAIQNGHKVIYRQRQKITWVAEG